MPEVQDVWGDALVRKGRIWLVSRNMKLDDNDRICHKTRVLVDFVLLRTAQRWRIGCVRVRLQDASDGDLGPLGLSVVAQSSFRVRDPFNLSRVPLPSEAELTSRPRLADVVPPWCLKYLEDRERMLRWTDDHERLARECPVETYVDPAWWHCYRSYLRLIRKLHSLKMLR